MLSRFRVILRFAAVKVVLTRGSNWLRPLSITEQLPELRRMARAEHAGAVSQARAFGFGVCDAS